MPNKPFGLGRNASNYGDPAFALYLRRSFAKSMGYSQAMLDKPVVGIADTASDYNNCHRTIPELIEAASTPPAGCRCPSPRSASANRRCRRARCTTAT